MQDAEGRAHNDSIAVRAYWSKEGTLLIHLHKGQIGGMPHMFRVTHMAEFRGVLGIGIQNQANKKVTNY